MNESNELTQYQGWSEEQVAADSEAVENSGGSAEYWKPQVGRSVVRFLPAPVGRVPMVVTHQHYIELPGRPKVVFACPRAMSKLPCPACAKSDALFATKSAADREQAFGLRPRLRVYANIIDRSAPDKGPLVWGFGKTIYEQLRALRADPDIGDFFRTDASGFDIIVERKGTTKNDTEYHVRPSTKSVALGDLGVLDVQHDIGRFAEVLSYADILAKLKGEKPKGDLPATTTGGVAQGLPAPTPASAAAASRFGF